MDWIGIGFTVCFGLLTGRVIFRKWEPAWIAGCFTWAILKLLGIL